MRISSTDVIEGGRVLYTIGKIKAASAWYAANGVPPQANWRELVLRELIRRAEDIDADAIIGFDYLLVAGFFDCLNLSLGLW